MHPNQDPRIQDVEARFVSLMTATASPRGKPQGTSRSSMISFSRRAGCAHGAPSLGQQPHVIDRLAHLPIENSKTGGAPTLIT
jgi:hypothetical protein